MASRCARGSVLAEFRRLSEQSKSSFPSASGPHIQVIAYSSSRRPRFVRWISLSPLYTEEGALISASIRDVTDRKQNEQEMRRIQGHLLSAVESIQGAFAIFDAQDRLVLCNSSYRQMFARALPGEIVGRAFEELLDDALAGDLFYLGDTTAVESHGRFVENHRHGSAAMDVRTTDGKQLRIVERRTGEGGTVMTIWDVTEDLEHEEELRSAREAAEAASSAKSEFLASMSHEAPHSAQRHLGLRAAVAAR